MSTGWRLTSRIYRLLSAQPEESGDFFCIYLFFDASWSLVRTHHRPAASSPYGTRSRSRGSAEFEPGNCWAAPLGQRARCCVAVVWLIQVGRPRKTPSQNSPWTRICVITPSHFRGVDDVRGEEVSRPATQSNIYSGRKYCRRCRQADVLVPPFHSRHFRTFASAVKVPSYFRSERGFLGILESFPEHEVPCWKTRMTRCPPCSGGHWTMSKTIFRALFKTLSRFL